jgi:hypothetical protein
MEGSVASTDVKDGSEQDRASRLDLLSSLRERKKTETKPAPCDTQQMEKGFWL